MEKIKQIWTALTNWATAIANDKLLHFLCSFFITCVSVAIFGWLGLIVPIVASFGKEAYDHFFGNGWHWHDLIADGAGLGVGVLTILLL